jgi:hypothetical protein
LEFKTVATEKVEFDAHKDVKRPTKVAFTTNAGDRVKFVAEKRVKVPVHVEFDAKRKK